MQPNPTNASFNPGYFPLHIGLLSVGENMFPIGNWTVISKDPFRFLLAIGVGNHSLQLLRKYKEAALHFMPWRDRDRVIAAGHISGRKRNKAAELGFNLLPAEKLTHTRLVAGADNSFELVMYRELMHLSREYQPVVMDVVYAHYHVPPTTRQPLLYLSLDDFATLGEHWQYKK